VNVTIVGTGNMARAIGMSVQGTLGTGFGSGLKIIA
jgi:hypothetical protein